MSSTSVDLPEPETPVTTVSRPSGKVASMDLRLLARAADGDGLAVGRAALARDFDGELAADVLPRHGSLVAGDLLGRARGDDLAAVRARGGAEVYDVVGPPDGLLVVLDDEDGVAEVAQRRERLQQLLVVARDRKSTRLNSSHANMSYAVFCLNKKIGHTSSDTLAILQRYSGAPSTTATRTSLARKTSSARVVYRRDKRRRV